MKKRLFLLLILFCFFMVPKNAFAQSQYTLTPASMRHYTTNTFTSTRVNFGSYQDFGTPTYGFEFTSSSTRYGIAYYFNNNQNINNKSLDIDFVVFNRLKSDTVGVMTAYIRDEHSHINSCDVHAVSSLDLQKFYGMSGSGDTIEQLPSSVGSYSVVSCKNVVVDSGFDLLFSGPFSGTGIFSISALNAKINASGDLKSSIDKGTEATNKQTETIKDSDTSDSLNSANSFFGDFQDDDYGLSDVITMPLEFIKGLASSSCSSLNLPLPFVDTNLTLPCMTSIYSQYFGSFLTLYQAITTGFIAYWVCINIFRLVQGFKNPDNDEVEVMEL